MRVKICGITRLQDALAAEAAGADALGFVFYAASPRAVTVAQAAEIISQLPPFISTVALFVDASAEEVRDVLSQVDIDVLQFHGNESAQFCQQFAKPWIKALRVENTEQLASSIAEYSNASALLLDAYDENLAGGTGKTFDWQMVPEHISRPWILAGGLNPENVAEAINQTSPWAVDVSGGVEQSKGIKSAEKISAFVQQAKNPEP